LTVVSSFYFARPLLAAFKSANCRNALCIGVTLVGARLALVNLLAARSVTFIFCIACACERAHCVATRGVFVAIMITSFTFVNIFTFAALAANHSVALEAGITLASEIPDSVRT
jgi:hypothetical protein